MRLNLAGGMLAQLLLVALLIGYGSLFTVYPKASAISSPRGCSGSFRLERLPGGAYTHWKTPPCHGAHPPPTFNEPFVDTRPAR
jgi:hypothetical protein